MVINTEDFQHNSSLAFSLSRNVTLSFESVRLCDRAVSGLVTRVMHTYAMYWGGGGGGRSIVLSVIMV